MTTNCTIWLHWKFAINNFFYSIFLSVQQVNTGSIADKAGLKAGDGLVRLNSTDLFNLRHKEAQDAIVKAGGAFELVVQRWVCGSSESFFQFEFEVSFIYVKHTTTIQRWSNMEALGDSNQLSSTIAGARKLCARHKDIVGCQQATSKRHRKWTQFCSKTICKCQSRAI